MNFDLKAIIGDITFSPERDAEICAAEEREREEEERKAMLRRMERMNIEPEMYGKTLDNFSCKTERQREALDAARDLVSGRIKKLVLLGKNGTGKTHIASAVVKECGGIILTIFEMGLMLRNAYSAGGEIALLDKWTKVPCLAIDELEKVRNTENILNNLNYILDKRHTRGLKTILVSNYHLRRSCKSGGCGCCFETLLNDAIVSRFRQETRILEIDGEDWRRD